MSSTTPRYDQTLGRPLQGWRLSLYTIIFEADTKAGRFFDVALIATILLSILFVMLGSVASINAKYANIFNLIEIAFTVLFTLEYIARLVCVRHPLRYALSFFGIVDLLAILPSYLALFFPEVYVLVDIRVLRLLRIFRIFKLTAYLTEFMTLGAALRASSRKIFVFLSVVIMIIVVMGTIMYAVEGPQNGFTSIPTSIYWAITTMTTVGFGDITPKTDLGRFIASSMMLMGWGVLAVPTGIVTAEMSAQHRKPQDSPVPTTRTCHVCLTEGHAASANFCQHCGAALPSYQHHGTNEK
jgi:voltage-gated potassium channel